MQDIDFDAFVAKPLDHASLRCLRYMHDVEHHTICYLRDLLVTRAHRDPDITAFLTMWTFEEYWHGEAIGRGAGRPRRAGRSARGSRPLAPAARLRDRLAPILHGLGSAVVGDAYTAVHMTWGAVNEWTTQAGYARLAARANHPAARPSSCGGSCARRAGTSTSTPRRRPAASRATAGPSG